MVGVPRSLGCRHCRRKKKGCDMKKPTCGQCARLNILCGYDEKRWQFINQEPAPSTSTVRSQSNDGLKQTDRQTLVISRSDHHLHRTAFEIDSHGEFWQVYYPQDDHQTPYVAGISTAPWTRTLRDIAALDATANTALNAVAMNIVGRTRSDPALLQESTRLYAIALRDTNRALQDPIKAQSDAVLTCCKILSMYEYFRVDRNDTVSSQGEDFWAHVDGICRIVELRGPEKHVSNHGHTLFEDARVLAVIAGITRRRPNFFIQAAWHTVPWESSPRNFQDNLIDIIIALPSLLRDQDVLSQTLARLKTNNDRFVALTDGQKHINRCIRIGEALREWEQNILYMCLEVSGLTTPNYAGPVTLLEICKSHGYGFFNVCMQFWVSCLLLYATTWVSYRKITSAVRLDQLPSLPAWLSLPDIPECMNPRVAASNIVSCAPHYFEPSAGLWGTHASSFAIGGALHYFAATGGTESEEMAQLRRLLGGVTGNFLKSIANTADSAKGDPEKKEEHEKMATSWYGMDPIRQDRASSSPEQ